MIWFALGFALGYAASKYDVLAKIKEAYDFLTTQLKM